MTSYLVEVRVLLVEVFVEVELVVTSFAEVDQFGTVIGVALGRGRKLRSKMLV